MATTELKCDKHHTPTQLTCAQCGRPACPKCLVWTEVGQKCRTCVPGKNTKGRNPLLVPAVLAVVLIIALLFAFGAFSGGDSKPKVAAGNRGDNQPGLGQPARDGALTFVVTRFDCGATELGEGPGKAVAKGRYCLLEFKATNTGNQPASFATPQQLLLDRQRRRFAPDLDATGVYQRSTTGSVSTRAVQQMNPGAEVDSVLIFDIPEGVNPELAELHAGPTLGVTVRLTESAGSAAS